MFANPMCIKVLMVLLKANFEADDVADPLCTVGVEDGRIPDSAMTASSSWSDSYRAYYGRLNNHRDIGGFWHAGSKLSFLIFFN